MKYGREYSQALASEDFPETWISAAVSYRELKKCIKRIQEELSSLGLDAETLQHLTSSFEVRKNEPGSHTFAETARFSPELWVATERRTGRFLDAGLTKKTRDYLLQRGAAKDEASPANGAIELDERTSFDGSAHSRGLRLANENVEWKQVPISTITDFFDALDPKLARQEDLQIAESKRLDQEIVRLGHDIELLTEPVENKHHKFKPKDDVAVWRRLFELYTESTVFFSCHEQDHGVRNFVLAKQQLQVFSDLLVKQDIVRSFKSPRSRVAFDNFVQINLDILRVMRFQEINAMAVRKILKKFDKRTALNAAPAYQAVNPSSLFAKSIAKDMCAELSSKVVSVVPQMADYICPICCELAWRPIRLGCCNSVFCIRCVIKLQRDGEERCPMCRSTTIMHADSASIDAKTAEYLMRHFPKEVKARQKANERAAGIDKYGESFYRNTCAVM